MKTSNPGSSPSLEEFLARNREAIFRSLYNHPMVEVTYAETPREESRGITASIYFGVLPRGSVFDVWTLDEEAEDPLVWEDSFRSLEQAKKLLLLRASEIQTMKGELIDGQKDAMWQELKASLPALIGPFEFVHSTHFPHGCSFEFECDVLEFFEENSGLLIPAEGAEAGLGSLYDGSGSRCCVAVTHRGEMALIPPTQGAAFLCLQAFPVPNQTAS